MGYINNSCKPQLTRQEQNKMSRHLDRHFTKENKWQTKFHMFNTVVIREMHIGMMVTCHSVAMGLKLDWVYQVRGKCQNIHTLPVEM